MYINTLTMRCDELNTKVSYDWWIIKRYYTWICL